MKFFISILFLFMFNEIVQYRIEYTNERNNFISIVIEDFKELVDATTATVRIVKLQPGTDPLFIEAFNTTGRLYGAFGKRATFSFKSTQQYSMKTFSEGEDGRFFCTITAGNKVLLKGNVVMDDNRRRYVPGSTDVFISVTDGLANLGGIELTDFDGVRINPDVPVTRIKLLAYALYKTGLGINIEVIDNLYEGQMLYRTADPDDIKNNPWDQSWQWPLTHEKEIDVMNDCLKVINSLLGANYRLCFHNDRWRVQRLMEMKFGKVSYTRFNAGGAAIAGVMDEDITINVGHKSVTPDVYFVHLLTEVTGRRPSKSTQIEWKYNVPDDIPRNKSFLRGVLNAGLTASFGFDCYDIIDWTTGQDSGGVIASAYIVSKKVDGYEKERYIEFSPDGVPDTWIMCKKIWLVQGDKFKWGIDRQLSSDLSGGGNYTDVIAKIRLYANDLTYYTLHGGTTTDPQIRWVQCNAAFTTNQRVISYQGTANNDDLTEWHNKTIEAAPLPKTGYVVIQIYQSAIAGSTRYTRFQNQQFTYIPLVNGSYKTYTGERVKVTRTGNYSNPKEAEIFFNSSSKFLFKGALLRYSTDPVETITLLTDRWNDRTLQTEGITAYPETDKLLTRFAIEHFNQYREFQREFNYSMKGLIDADGKLCDLIHVFNNLVNDDDNKNKLFVLLNYTQNWKTEEWTGNGLEIDDSTRKFAAANEMTVEHKYLEQ